MGSAAKVPGLGLFQLFTVLFGTIIGVAWIVATGMWIGEAGPIGALIAFGSGALVMWLIGLCFAEMMGLYPDANGSMAYVFEAFGERASAMAGWFLVLSYTATCGWYFVTVAWLTQAVVPWLGGPIAYHVSGGSVRVGDLVLGLTGTVVITAVNLRGVSARAAFQDALVVTKIAIGLALFLCAVLFGHTERLEPLFKSTAGRGVWASIAAVAVMTPFFFAGFDVLPQAVRDRRPGTPLKAIGAIVGLATLAAFLFYGGAIVSASVSLDRSALSQASLPVVEAFRVGLGQPWLAVLVVVAGVSGILTGWNANLMSGARVLQGMAQAGVTLPAFAGGRVRAPGEPDVPVRATLFVSILAVLMGLLGRNALGPLVDVAVVPLLVVFALVCAGLIKLRRTRPQAERPYRVPGGLTLPILAFLLSIGLIIAAMATAFTGAGAAIQCGFMTLWCVAGFTFWRRAAVYRRSIGVAERKRRVLQGEF